MKDDNDDFEELDDDLILPPPKYLVPTNMQIKYPEEGDPPPVPAPPALPVNCIISMRFSSIKSVDNNSNVEFIVIVQQPGPWGIATVEIEVYEKKYLLDMALLGDSTPQNPLPFTEVKTPVKYIDVPGGVPRPMYAIKQFANCPKSTIGVRFKFPKNALDGKLIKAFAHARCCDQEDVNVHATTESEWTYIQKT